MCVHRALGDVLRIAQQIASGLAAAHDQGLVHRDIKPANILLDDGVDRLVITDFGLARAVDDASVTRTGVIAGTPQYMSPEQARGENVDSRSDLFSLGSVMYAMCTGHVPFRAESPYGVLRRITDNSPRPIQEINPEIPLWLTDIIERLHTKSPSGRFASAHDVEALLTQCIAHVHQPVANPLPMKLNGPHAAQRFVQRWWKPTSLLAAAVLSALVILPGKEVRSPTTNSLRQPTSAAPEIRVPGTLPSDGFPEAVVPAKGPHDADFTFPWESDAVEYEWNDNLDGVFLHIEQSIHEMATP